MRWAGRKEMLGTAVAWRHWNCSARKRAIAAVAAESKEPKEPKEPEELELEAIL